MQNKVFDAYDSLFSVRFFLALTKTVRVYRENVWRKSASRCLFMYIEYSRRYGYEVLKKYVYILK